MTFQFHGMTMPEHLEESLTLYAEHGVPTGDFLRACLANDLLEAAGRADGQNIHNLGVIAAYIYNELPRGSHGSREAVDAWLKSFRKADEDD